MSGSAHRRFAAIVDSDGVHLAEISRSKDGFRVIGEWSDERASATPAEAAERLTKLMSAQAFKRANVSIALQHFGSFHHIMALPAANDSVVRPIIAREVQRLFGVSDAVVAFTPGAPAERRSPERADIHTAPRQYLIGGAPRGTVDAIVQAFQGTAINVDCLTVVPEALRRMYAATSPSPDPTAVLVCLAGGPQLAFFLNGRLELTMDPPIALEGEQLSSPAMVIAQFERGAVYFRQQFRGAEATQLLLSAPAALQESLGPALHERFGIRVRALMPQIASPEAIIAIGAVLEAASDHPVDLYPHAPTAADRLRVAVRGPNAIVAGLGAAAAAALLWTLVSAGQLVVTSRHVSALEREVRRESAEVDPLRNEARARAGAAQTRAILRSVGDEGHRLSAQLAALAQAAPASLAFDSLRVERKQAGWTGVVAGRVTASSSTDGVRAVNTFYHSLQTQPGISSPVLDQFDYPASKEKDSTVADGAVVIQFRVSFGMTPSGAGV
jgi:hypothetical protein